MPWFVGSSFQPQGIGYGNFSWNVQVRDDRGLASPKSDTWNFTDGLLSRTESSLEG